jgi:hypothetical protein
MLPESPRPALLSEVGSHISGSAIDPSAHRCWTDTLA